MNTHSDKAQDDKSQAVANTVSKKQTSGESSFQFVDNRPEAVQMQKLQEMANDHNKNNSLQYVDNRPIVAQMEKLQQTTQKKDGVVQLNKKSKKKEKKIQKGIAYREKMEQRQMDQLLGKDRLEIIPPNYESATQSTGNVVNNPRKFYDVVTQKVKEILSSVNYRIGGSSAAKEHGASRHPQDLDLEFWTYKEAKDAAKILTAYKHAEGDLDLYDLYYYVNDDEDEVSVTVSSMVVEKKGKPRGPGPTIELNNENQQMSDEDYRILPKDRIKQEDLNRETEGSGRLVRRGSLIAGSLLRYSTYKKEGGHDLKQDIPLIRSLLKKGIEDSIPLSEIFSKIDMPRLKEEEPEIFKILNRVAHMESLKAGDTSLENVLEVLKEKEEPLNEMVGKKNGKKEASETDDELSDMTDENSDFD